MEILSPSSNMEHIEVAIDGRANAVYGGIKKWNARNKAINFTTDEYNLLIAKLHQNNIKFFLTLNILMLDNEIKEVIEFLKNNSLPDAFIVADVGLIRELHKEFPNVPLYFSTQFGAHNVDDVNFIKSLNGKRAVLSRELTLNEINNIKKNVDIELECFIWGSQCLSFSGLCFFGTLINGGGGNRGKCIITCRDIYSINGNCGHYLYVPDMDCINLISKLDGIDCLKIEGRRRKSQEIKNVLNKIIKRDFSNNATGYLLGTNINDNGLYEKINTRIKPIMKAMDLDGVNDKDICIEYVDGTPQSFSNDYNNPNVMYVYTEIKKPYVINKKNLSFDLVVENNIVKELLYVNYKGDGTTFFGSNDNLIEINIDKLIQEIEQQNKQINIYKVKYKRINKDNLKINKDTYEKIIEYIVNDCKEKEYHHENGEKRLKSIYLETTNTEVVKEYINDNFVKVIYDIATVGNLKNIEKTINEFGDKLIYKLPLFNWKSEDLLPYLNLLKNKKVMFTRFTQIYICENIEFKRKYVDYTIYVWNKRTLEDLKEKGIDEFTTSPELSYKTNENIFGDEKMQVILGGKLPMVYTRNCFSHMFNCTNCKENQCNKKEITNKDKKMNFEIFCNTDYRYVLNSDPILNDYSKLKVKDNTNYRYITTGQSKEEIKNSVACLKKDNYYTELKKIEFWKNSYECNLFEGKE